MEDREQKKIAKVQRKEKEMANCEMQNIGSKMGPALVLILL